jgi:hypothetical protein
MLTPRTALRDMHKWYQRVRNYTQDIIMRQSLSKTTLWTADENLQTVTATKAAGPLCSWPLRLGTGCTTLGELPIFFVGIAMAALVVWLTKRYGGCGAGVVILLLPRVPPMSVNLPSIPLEEAPCCLVCMLSV